MGLLGNWAALRALYNHARRKNEKAMRLYAHALKKGTGNSVALSAYALLLLRHGNFAQAEKAALLAGQCTKKPKQARNARLNFALSQWKLGRLDEAIAIYEAEYAEFQSGSMRGVLGFFYIARGDRDGDYEKALRFNREAVAFDEDDPVLLDNLGQVLLRMGEWEEAESCFVRALDKSPEQFDSLVCLARCKLRAGDEAEARALLIRALKRPLSHLNTIDRGLAEELYGQLEVKQG